MIPKTPLKVRPEQNLSPDMWKHHGELFPNLQIKKLRLTNLSMIAQLVNGRLKIIKLESRALESCS